MSTYGETHGTVNDFPAHNNHEEEDTLMHLGCQSLVTEREAIFVLNLFIKALVPKLTLMVLHSVHDININPGMQVVYSPHGAVLAYPP